MKDNLSKHGSEVHNLTARRPFLSRILLLTGYLVSGLGYCEAPAALESPFSTSLARAGAESRDPITLIQRDFLSGKLSIDEKAILTVRAIRLPASLPIQYQVQSPSGPKLAGMDPTLMLMEIRQNWSQLSDSAQRFINSTMTRQSTAFTFQSASGFFKLHYDTVGVNAVPPADSNQDSVPDYVERCASYADTALHKHQLLGYLLPPSDGSAGGDSTYDIYFEHMSLYYGYAQPEIPGPHGWGDYTSYFVLNNNFLGFPPDQDPEGIQAGAAKVTCAHEFHHACQCAYNISNSPSWFTELDAVYMETVIFPKVNDNYNYLPEFFDSPERSLMESYSHGASCFIWGDHLAERFDTSLMVAVWNGARYTDLFATMNDTLQARYGWTVDSVMGEFAVWNYFTGSRNDGLHYRDGANYPVVSMAVVDSSYPVLTQTSPTRPAGYGAGYIQFLPNGSSGKLHVVFDGDDNFSWGAFLIKSTGNHLLQVQKLTLNSGSAADTADMYGFGGDTSVVLVGLNTGAYSGPANFTYSAEVRRPYAITSALVPDSIVYSGASRQYRFTARNSAPIEDVVKLTWSDQFGWMRRDSVTKDLLPGDSFTASVNVTPPVGTSLGSSSELTFRAKSLNDTTSVSRDSLRATVMLQRGDLNFSGFIDLADLSYLVSYLTANGATPIPVAEAGNFNCAGIVDLEDLSALAAYLTGAGSRPPCSPF